MKNFTFRYNTCAKIFAIIAVFFNLIRTIISNMSYYFDYLNAFKEHGIEYDTEFSLRYLVNEKLITTIIIHLVIIVILLIFISKKTTIGESGIYNTTDNTKSKASWDDISFITITSSTISCFSDYSSNTRIFKTKSNSKLFEDMISFTKNIASDKNIKCVSDEPLKQNEEISFGINGPERLKGFQVLLLIYLIFQAIYLIGLIVVTLTIMTLSAPDFGNTSNMVTELIKWYNLNPGLYTITTLPLLFIALPLNIKAIVYFFRKKRKAIKAVIVFSWYYFALLSIISIAAVLLLTRSESSNIISPYITITSILISLFRTLTITSYISNDHKTERIFIN